MIAAMAQPGNLRIGTSAHLFSTIRVENFEDVFMRVSPHNNFITEQSKSKTK